MTGQTRIPVSVVIPAYNRVELLPRALASIHRQEDYSPAEVIVVDDASSDGSAEKARDLGATVIVHDRNQGAGRARSTGIAAASQPWLAFLDSDDEWLPRHLASLWPLAPNATLVTGATIVAEDGRPTASAYSGVLAREPLELVGPQSLYPDNFVAASGVLVRTEAVRAVGGPDTTLPYAEDLDLWLRVLEQGRGIATPQPVVRYHVHPGQKSPGEGSRATQREIVASYAQRDWWRPALVHYNAAFRGWDAAREHLRAGRRLQALRELARILRHPARVDGLVRLLVRRMRLRRRASAVSIRGEPVVALAGRTPDPPAGEPSLDLRGQALWRVAIKLAIRPPGCLQGDRRVHAALGRVLGIETRIRAGS